MGAIQKSISSQQFKKNCSLQVGSRLQHRHGYFCCVTQRVWFAVIAIHKCHGSPLSVMTYLPSEYERWLLPLQVHTLNVWGKTSKAQRHWFKRPRSVKPFLRRMQGTAATCGMPRRIQAAILPGQRLPCAILGCKSKKQAILSTMLPRRYVMMLQDQQARPAQTRSMFHLSIRTGYPKYAQGPVMGQSRFLSVPVPKRSQAARRQAPLCTHVLHPMLIVLNSLEALGEID